MKNGGAHFGILTSFFGYEAASIITRRRPSKLMRDAVKYPAIGWGNDVAAVDSI